MELLEIVNVSKYYKNKKAVDDISLSVREGEVLGMIGPNGAGKSTLISMIGTLLKADSGEILYQGKSIVKEPQLIRKSLGYVPQEIALYTMLSGIDNLMFWGGVYHLDKKILKTRIEKVREFIGISKEQLTEKVSTYSGGMKRRLNIGVALLHNPKLVLMDEPTAGIDLKSVKQILDTIQLLKEHNVTVIYAGHIMDELEEICDRICIISEGKLLAAGNQNDLRNESGKKISLKEYYLNIVG